MRLDEFNHKDAKLDKDDEDFLDDLDAIQDLEEEGIPEAEEFYEMADEDSFDEEINDDDED